MSANYGKPADLQLKKHLELFFEEIREDFTVELVENLGIKYVSTQATLYDGQKIKCGTFIVVVGKLYEWGYKVIYTTATKNYDWSNLLASSTMPIRLLYGTESEIKTQLKEFDSTQFYETLCFLQTGFTTKPLVGRTEATVNLLLCEKSKFKEENSSLISDGTINEILHPLKIKILKELEFGEVTLSDGNANETIVFENFSLNLKDPKPFQIKTLSILQLKNLKLIYN